MKHKKTQNMKHNFKKISFLLILTFGFLFTACEKESIDANQKQNENSIVINSIDKDDLSPNALNSLDGIIVSSKKLLASNKIVDDAENGFYIDTDFGKHLQLGNYHSYTFQITRYNDSKLLENLVLSLKPDGTYKAFILSYDLSLEEKEKIANGIAIDLSHKTTLTVLAKFDVNTVLNKIIALNDGTCWDEIFGNSPMTGWEGVIGYTPVRCPPGPGSASSSGASGATDVSGSGTTNGSTGNPNNNNGAGDNTGVHGGSSSENIPNVSNPPRVISTPVVSNLIYNVRGDNYLHLSSPQIKWLNTQTTTIRNAIILNSRAEEISEAFVKTIIDFSININNTEVIDYLISDAFSLESQDFANHVINEIANTPNNPLPSNVIIIRPNQTNEIKNINDYLKCFDPSQPAVLTMYVDQPTANSNSAWSGNPLSQEGPNVGHTFISIKQGNYRRLLGFYPKIAVNLDNPANPGVLQNNSIHEFDVSISLPINASGLSNLINYIKTKSTAIYNLNTYNCTDFGMGAAAAAGLSLPSAYGTWGFTGIGSGAGDNPGQLGQNIRNYPIKPNMVITTTTGTAPTNIGN
jgi:hypothetical protein